MNNDFEILKNFIIENYDEKREYRINKKQIKENFMINNKSYLFDKLCLSYEKEILIDGIRFDFEYNEFNEFFKNGCYISKKDFKNIDASIKEFLELMVEVNGGIQNFDWIKDDYRYIEIENFLNNIKKDFEKYKLKNKLEKELTSKKNFDTIKKNIKI